MESGPTTSSHRLGAHELTEADAAIDRLRGHAQRCRRFTYGRTSVEQSLRLGVVYRLAIQSASHLARSMASPNAIVKTSYCG